MVQAGVKTSELLKPQVGGSSPPGRALICSFVAIGHRFTGVALPESNVGRGVRSSTRRHRALRAIWGRGWPSGMAVVRSSTEMPIHKRETIKLVLALGMAALLGACAAPVPRRYAGAPMGNQGGAWEAVLPGVDVSSASTYWNAPEYTRRDRALGRKAQGALVGDDPTSQTRSSLSSQGRIRTSTSTRNFIFYQRPGQGGAGWW